MKEINLTHHAADVMLRRDISISEVSEVLHDYEVRRQSSSFDGKPYDPFVFVFQRGQLAVVAREEPTRFLVITVLLKRSHQWDDEEARTRRDA